MDWPYGEQKKCREKRGGLGIGSFLATQLSNDRRPLNRDESMLIRSQESEHWKQIVSQQQLAAG